MQDSHDQKLDALLEFALDAGATKVKLLSAKCVWVEDRLADLCREPKCPHFGQSMSCPPYVSGPSGMRKLLQSCQHAIVFRLEIQSSSLLGEDRPVVMRLLHEITAAIELEAKRLGFTESVGFAGGSCKPSFCHDQENCRVVAKQGECRHPDHARTSMSGYGINAGELMKSAGWSTNLFKSNNNGDAEQLSWVAALVLLR